MKRSKIGKVCASHPLCSPLSAIAGQTGRRRSSCIETKAVSCFLTYFPLTAARLLNENDVSAWLVPDLPFRMFQSSGHLPLLPLQLSPICRRRVRRSCLRRFRPSLAPSLLNLDRLPHPSQSLKHEYSLKGSDRRLIYTMTNWAAHCRTQFKNTAKAYLLDRPRDRFETLFGYLFIHLFYLHEPPWVALTSNLPRFYSDILGNHIFSECTQDQHSYF